MNNYPDFSAFGYQVTSQLGANIQGGRVTYLATNLKKQTPVVIKQFQFATMDDESGYKAVQRELTVLRNLSHQGIPKYISQFDNGEGMCLVQQYIDGKSLADSRDFTTEEVVEIARQILSILVYLQSRLPLVIHRDIKPENIILSNQGNLQVYLVDFGFARIGGGEVTALSSMVAGTAGFMPPEQLLNRPLGKNSDLYGLGATLICLLTGLKSTQLVSLVNTNFSIRFQPLINHLHPDFILWLERMVHPQREQRFDDAKTALKLLNEVKIKNNYYQEFNQDKQKQLEKTTGRKSLLLIKYLLLIIEIVCQYIIYLLLPIGWSFVLIFVGSAGAGDGDIFFSTFYEYNSTDDFFLLVCSMAIFSNIMNMSSIPIFLRSVFLRSQKNKEDELNIVLAVLWFGTQISLLFLLIMGAIVAYTQSIVFTLMFYFFYSCISPILTIRKNYLKIERFHSFFKNKSIILYLEYNIFSILFILEHLIICSSVSRILNIYH